MQLCSSLNILWHCLSLRLEWKLTFPVLWQLLSFPNLLAYWVCSKLTASSRIWKSSAGIWSPALALFVVMLPKTHLTSHSRMSGSRWVIIAAAAQSLQLCLTLCSPTDGSPQGSPVPEIPQARTLEWVAISFSNAGKWKGSHSVVRLLATPWTAAYQAPPSMWFSRREYWSGVPLPSPYHITSC